MHSCMHIFGFLGGVMKGFLRTTADNGGQRRTTADNVRRRNVKIVFLRNNFMYPTESFLNT